jgi:hypothetical protein
MLIAMNNNASPTYQVLLHPWAYAQAETYRADLDAHGLGGAGAYLRALLRDQPLADMDTAAFLEHLAATKRPQIFAESDVYGDGRDWTLRELTLLGDLGFAVPVTVFDDGRHERPQVHAKPFAATLLFVSGALLRNGHGLPPADWEVAAREGRIDAEAYQALYARRLLPLLHHASERGVQTGRPALITVPGLGCGQFAGPFEGQLGAQLKAALMALFAQHHAALPGIRAVYFDPYAECGNERHEFGTLSLLVRPLPRGNEAKPQLCPPSAYQDAGDGFAHCDLYSVVAWDHVSWPGNDFYVNSRATDDGVKAAATDAMRALTGLAGEYDRHTFKYRPPQGFRDWRDVVAKQGARLQVRDRLRVGPAA